MKCTSPTSSLLKGVCVSLKDNIALAGVQCTNGTGAVNWIPEVDATLATRILDAGGIITGKAACENNCFGAVSDTSITGVVHNPHADGYSAGGSSSGSGRLVATGQCDMSVGADQGGSIRIPSANCGLVGLKPTWGLVPYTGCISLESTIDHVGPMTKNVPDCARLLEVIAGSDGIDDRQPHTVPQGHTKYSEEIASLLELPAAKQLDGLKIGILKEGFENPLANPNVLSKITFAIQRFTTLGATTTSISIPEHTEGGTIWMVSLPQAAVHNGLLANAPGRKQLAFPNRCTQIGSKLSQQAFEALGPGGQNIYLRGLFLQQKFGSPLSARCTNLLRKLNDAYDAALAEFDVIVMPTITFLPCKLRTENQLLGAKEEMQPLEMLSRTVGVTANTAGFNATGHPALSLPVGFVANDEGVKLPVGLQIVGRKWRDVDCLRVAAAWEAAGDWKSS